jgi:Histidine kinase-, DNA gyrase B-, and HSP90-like ATPase
VQVALYRVAQEALQNIAKHARARHVWVTLQLSSDMATLEVRDDGRGFDPTAVAGDHFGLAIMRERMAAIGGAVTVESRPGDGATVPRRWPGHSTLQLKAPPALQDRAFALLFQLMYLATPLSLLATGVLVDNVLEPAVGTPAWEAVAPLVGSAPGSGMGLLMLVAGALMFVITALVYAHPATRGLERELPDQTEVLAAE